MKRLFAATAIILLLAGAIALHVVHLESLTGDLIGQLEEMDACLARKEWTKAGQMAQKVSEQWERQAFYLHTTLRHTDIDTIRTSLKEVSAYLEARDDAAECHAATARLINQLELLLEAELPTIKNLL